MNRLNQSPLSRKLTLVVMLSVGLALTLAVGTFLALEILAYRGAARQGLEDHAQILEDSAATAMVSGNLHAFEKRVAALGSHHGIAEASILDPSGVVLVRYPSGSLPAASPHQGPGDTLALSHPIQREGKLLGTLVLRADTRELWQRIRWILTAALLAAAAIGCATWLLAAELSRRVMTPIVHLTETARRIAERRSVDRCVLLTSQDEVGVLVEAFNAMLDQLWERQSHLEEYQRLAHLGSWTFDPESRRFEWSEETFRIFGMDPGEAPPDYEDFRNRFPREGVRILEKAILRTRARRTNLEGDFRLLKPGGVPLWIHLTCNWYQDPSSQKRLRGTVMDITDRKQAEVALLQGQKLESLGVLAGGIAHDFNNLLAALRANLDLARTGLQGSEQSGMYLSKAEKIIERAANLTRQLLAYSGKGQFLLKPLDLTNQVKEMGHLLAVSMTAKADVRYEVVEGLPAIHGDPAQIQQVVMNLVINAGEATGDRGGSVRIRTGSEYLDESQIRSMYGGQDLAAGPYIFLEVQDDGHGMDARTLERIFDPFFSTKAQGRGLGLAAIQGIVKSHKGGIRVSSSVGQGTTFKVLFPSSNTFLAKPAPIEPSSQFNRSGRILVVDDEPDIRLAAFDTFEHLGFEAILAADGLEALERVKEHQGDLRLILLDLTMPRMGGIECLKAIRAVDPAVPVLMTSGYSQSESARELAGLDFSGFLEKPYSLSSLKAKIREILG